MQKIKLLLLSMVLLFFTISNVFALRIDDFDSINPAPFKYKDEVGSLFNVSVVDSRSEHGRVLMIIYVIAKKGFAGWGVPLKNLDASEYKYLTFYVKGKDGNEQFQIGLKDSDGKEEKIESSSYFDVTTKWQKIKIPLSSFPLINIKRLDSITIGFNDNYGKGTLFIDGLEFEEEEYTDKQVMTKKRIELSDKMLIDGFERVSPYDFYTVRTGDDSTLNLNSSRLLHDGDYSMEMEYVLSTEKPWGTWVAAHWEAKIEPLDWTGLTELRLWVKGDGTDNVLQINIFDDDGEIWCYKDLSILKTTKWSRLIAPIEYFYLCNPSSYRNGELDLANVRAFEFSILSKSGRTTMGKIYIDQFQAFGKLKTIKSTPPDIVEELRVAIPTVGNIDLSGVLYNEYFWCPEESGKILHWGNIIANAKTGDYSARIEFASESQNFGDAAYMGYESSNPENWNWTTSIKTQSPRIISPSIQLMGNNIHPYVSNLIVGNIIVDYSKYIFSNPDISNWGWKGMTAEGDIKSLNYHAFYIDHSFDSYTAGTRWTAFLTNWKIAAYGVHSYESARVENESEVDGAILNTTTNWDIKPIFRDSLYNIDVWRWFMDRSIQVELLSGWNHFNKYAEADYTDPYKPTYSHKLSSIESYWDSIYLAQIESNDLFLLDLQLFGEYKYVGPEYKPRFRKEPETFDWKDADQKTYTLRATQKYMGIIFSGEYTDGTRVTDSRYGFYSSRFGIGYYGYYGLDVALSNYRYRGEYNATSSRSLLVIDQNEIYNNFEIYVRNQLTSKLALWFRINVESKEMGENLSNRIDANILNTKLEYYLNSNAKLSGEYKVSSYSDSDGEPQGTPFSDNFIKTYFEITF